MATQDGETAKRSAVHPDVRHQPAWAQMWEVAIIFHLLRLAVSYRGHDASLVRVYALGAYSVVWVG